MAITNVGDVSYHLSNELKRHWDNNSLKKIKKINMDKLYIVDGGEGTGKSVFTIQQAGYIDPSMFSSPEEFTSRICFTPDEFFETVTRVKNGVVIFDEAFRGFSSRAALSKINRRLVQLLQEMRQQNNLIFIVLPSIFLLDIYPAMLRSSGLFNIYIDKKSGKRVWVGYNKNDKNKLYQIGLKKGWKYLIKSYFRGYFYGKFPGGPKFEEAYLKKKAQALQDSVKEDNKKEIASKFKIQRDLALLFGYLMLNKYQKYSQRKFLSEIAAVTNDFMRLDQAELSRLAEKYREKGLFDELMTKKSI